MFYNSPSSLGKPEYGWLGTTKKTAIKVPKNALVNMNVMMKISSIHSTENVVPDVSTK
jgi:hypothetical protein